MNWLDTFLLSHNVDLTPLMTLQDMGQHFKNNFGGQVGAPIIGALGIAGFFYTFVVLVMAFVGDQQRRKSRLIQGVIGALVTAGCWFGEWGFAQSVGNGIGETVKNLLN